jgi:hypothetical protein
MRGAVGVLSQTPTVSASPDHSTGDCIGSLLTFQPVVLAAGHDATIQAVTVQCKVANTSAMDLILFNANPAATVTASGLTDNTAPTSHVDDLAKVIGVINITKWTSLGNGSQAIGEANNLAFPVELATTAMYGVLVARGTVNLASASDITVMLRAFRH